MIIKWINRYSGESGYVRDVNYKEKHFNNTYFKEEAQKFKNEESANKIINRLISYGEGNYNDFELVDR